jgi:Tfp pilus assembly protein PilV
MLHLRGQRGTSLIEAMIALVVLLIGAIGVIAAHRQGLRLASDARRLTRASAIAQDLVDQIALWPYGDPRLARGSRSALTDADIGDSNFLFETTASTSTLADHGDADLTLGGTQWNGIPTAVIQGYGPPFERYWNVAYVDDIDGDGVWDAVRIAVIVRWGDPASGYRRIVAYSTKANPRPTP